MQENKNADLPIDKISYLRNNLKNPYVQKQIKDIDDYKIVESLCKKPDEQGSGLTANQYYLKLIELLSHKVMSYIDFKFLKNDMDSWIVKSNLKYVNDKDNLTAIYKNIKEDNKSETPEGQKQNLLDFLNLCPQLMKVFEGEDLELLCDEIINKNYFILARVNELEYKIDPYFLRPHFLPSAEEMLYWKATDQFETQCEKVENAIERYHRILHNGPSKLIAFNNEASERFCNYLEKTYDNDKKVKLWNVLCLYLGDSEAGSLVLDSVVHSYRDDFFDKKYQENIELCSKSLINIYKLKQTSPDKQIFISKLFRWKSVLIAVELFLFVLMLLGCLDSTAIGTIVFIVFFGFVSLLDAILGLFVPKKFIGSWILSKIVVDKIPYAISNKLSINNLQKGVDNTVTTDLITTYYNQLLNQINNNKTKFVNEVKSHFKIESLSNISDNEIKYFLDCFNYFALEKLNDYVINNVVRVIKSNLKQKLLSRDYFDLNESYEVYQQAVEERFAADTINDMIEIACKKQTYALIFTKDNKNDFMEFIRKCILEEKKINVMPVDSPKVETIENQEVINSFQDKS